MTPPSDGTSKIWTFGLNAFQVHLTSLTAGHAIIVVVPHTTHLTVPFAPLLHSLEVNNQLLLIPNNEPTSLRPPHAAILTGPAVTKKIVNFHTDVTFVPGPTQPRTASQRGSSSLIKPPPWTPLQPFILERELRNYPDRVFVIQLIDNLRQGCDIGYTGPQFTICFSAARSN